MIKLIKFGFFYKGNIFVFCIVMFLCDLCKTRFNFNYFLKIRHFIDDFIMYKLK